jgi:GGDEF domain-containing protein
MKQKQQTVWVVSNINEERLLPLLVDEVSNLNELPTESPFAIILSKSEGQDWISLLTDLRSKKEYRYTPVFYHGDVGEKLHHLFDGPADDLVLPKATIIYERMASFGANIMDSTDKETILMAYLYSRNDMRIKGYMNHLSSYIYEYPLLTILFSYDASFDGWRFLQDLVMRDLLAQDALIDEIQTCSSCESGMLNLKKSCPNCNSINIKPQKFVHCFSCGKIGPVPEFLREERLICSRCKTKLHELGVDYEKPKEDKLCNSCGHFFAESDIEFVCLVCHRTSLPQGLTSRRLYEYMLTRRGEYLVRGIEKSIYRNFSHFFKVIDYSEFMSIANWQTKLAERYSSIYFSVMTLQITNAPDLIEQQGEINSERLMGQFFTSLRQVFRESDLSSRLDGTMYFLLPMANQDGCLVIINRITQAVHELAKEDIGKDLTVGVSYMTSSEIIQSELQGDLVVAELQARMVGSNIYLIGPK